MNCIYCNAQQPEKGFFCPSCFKQTKCKHCNKTLIVEAKICVFCGEEVGQKSSSANLNTIEFSETEAGRNFKASFSDTVGQSISDSFGMILANKISTRKDLPDALPSPNTDSTPNDTVDVEAEVVEDEYPPKINIPISKEIPSLTDIKLRDLAKTETDWIVVYAYYASDGGKKEFTRENIIQLYKDTGRKTDSRIKSLSQILKNSFKALYIRSTNDTNFILLDKGRLKAIEIFNGNSTSKSSNKSSTKNKSISDKQNPESNNLEAKSKKTKSTSSIGFIDLNFTLSEQKSLNDFFEIKKPTSQNEKVIVAMKWFIDYKKQSEISKEEISYLLNIAAEVPAALQQVINNIIGASYRWVTKGSKGKYQLSSIGENYIVNKLPKANK